MPADVATCLRKSSTNIKHRICRRHSLNMSGVHHLMPVCLQKAWLHGNCDVCPVWCVSATCVRLQLMWGSANHSELPHVLIWDLEWSCHQHERRFLVFNACLLFIVLLSMECDVCVYWSGTCANTFCGGALLQTCGHHCNCRLRANLPFSGLHCWRWAMWMIVFRNMSTLC